MIRTRIKLKGNDKAIVRFNNAADESYFVHIMVAARDRPGPHPKISIKARDGNEIPPFKPPKPIVKIDEKGRIPRGEPIPKQMTPIGKVVKTPTVEKEEKK